MWKDHASRNIWIPNGTVLILSSYYTLMDKMIYGCPKLRAALAAMSKEQKNDTLYFFVLCPEFFLGFLIVARFKPF